MCIQLSHQCVFVVFYVFRHKIKEMDGQIDRQTDTKREKERKKINLKMVNNLRALTYNIHSTQYSFFMIQLQVICESNGDDRPTDRFVCVAVK